MSVDLKMRLVRMRCCHCDGERGAELPELFAGPGTTCAMVALFCTWCSRSRMHCLVAPGKLLMVAV